MVERTVKQVPEGGSALGRRTGRAELDEHAEGVNTSEIIVTLDPHSRIARGPRFSRKSANELAQVPGAVISAEQPIQHLISHMLSGVKAQVGIKLYGDDLNVLRRTADANEGRDRGHARRDRLDGGASKSRFRSCKSCSAATSCAATG